MHTHIARLTDDIALLNPDISCSIYLSIKLSVFLSIFTLKTARLTEVNLGHETNSSIYLSINLSVFISIYLSICLSIFTLKTARLTEGIALLEHETSWLVPLLLAIFIAKGCILRIRWGKQKKYATTLLPTMNRNELSFYENARKKIKKKIKTREHYFFAKKENEWPKFS